MNNELFKKILYALGAVVCIGGFFVVFLWGVYQNQWESDFAHRIAKVFPIPVASVGGSVITLREYYADLDSIKAYFDSEEFKTAMQQAGQDVPMVSNSERSQVLDRLIEEEIISLLAKERDIQISDEEVEKAINEEFVDAESTREEFEEYLKKNYAWTIDDFKKHVVYPILIERKITLDDPEFSLQEYILQQMDKIDIHRMIRF